MMMVLLSPFWVLLSALLVTPIVDRYLELTLVRLRFGIIEISPQALVKMLVLVAMALYFLTRPAIILNVRLGQAILLFAAFFFGNSLLSDNPADSLSMLVRVWYWMLILLFCASYVKRTPAALKWLLCAGLVATAAYSIILWTAYFRHQVGAHYRLGEIYSGYYNPFAVAEPIAMLLPAVLLFPLVTKRRLWKVILAGGLCVGALGAILLTLGRSPLVAASVILVSFVGLSRRAPIRVPYATRLLGVTVVLFSSVMLYSYWSERGEASAARWASRDPNAFTTGRLQLYREGLEAFSRYGWAEKVAGLGTGFLYSRQINLRARGRPDPMHNDLLEVLVSGGVVGVLLYLWLASLLVREARRILNYSPLVGTGTIMCLAGYA